MISDVDKDTIDDISFGLPPCMPADLKRQNTDDREKCCDEMNGQYIEAIKELEERFEEDGIYGSLQGLKDEHYYKRSSSAAMHAGKMKPVLREVSKTLPKQLDLSARHATFVRFDEDEPRFLRALISGVEGTPYSTGLFQFDIYCPPDYPGVPCSILHTTPNANKVYATNGPGGFSPNLHQSSGKVCLSLLGTWNGPGWEAGKSNIYQVLSTIGWMILGAKHPYYMEPGYGGWEGTTYVTKQIDEEKVKEYDERVRFGTLVYATIDMIRQPPRGFEGVVRAHFRSKSALIWKMAQSWYEQGSVGFQCDLKPYLPQLRAALDSTLPLGDLYGRLHKAERALQFVLAKTCYLQQKIDRAVMDCLAAAQGRDTLALGELCAYKAKTTVGPKAGLGAATADPGAGVMCLTPGTASSAAPGAATNSGKDSSNGNGKNNSNSIKEGKAEDVKKKYDNNNHNGDSTARVALGRKLKPKAYRRLLLAPGLIAEAEADVVHLQTIIQKRNKGLGGTGEEMATAGAEGVEKKAKKVEEDEEDKEDKEEDDEEEEDEDEDEEEEVKTDYNFYLPLLYSDVDEEKEEGEEEWENIDGSYYLHVLYNESEDKGEEEKEAETNTDYSFSLPLLFMEVST